MTEPEHEPDYSRPCWERHPDMPKWCASLANGHPRCKKGTCALQDGDGEP